jgi:hypothetical protein
MKKMTVSLACLLLVAGNAALHAHHHEGREHGPMMQMGSERMSEMQEHMREMRETMEEIRATEDPQRKERLMHEHMQSMKQGMEKMEGAMRGCCPGQQGSPAMGMQQHMEMMQSQLQMMQMMIDQMIEHHAQHGPEDHRGSDHRRHNSR